METTDVADLTGRIMQNIKFRARRLAYDDAVRGMDVQDYEQDLAADLVHRRAAFNPALASFATFADRVVHHRVSTLKTPTARARAERNLASIDVVIADAECQKWTMRDVLPDNSLTEEKVTLGIDVRRFVENLSDPELQACGILLSDNISEAARAARIDRSTAYDRIGRLREHAQAQGLAEYVKKGSDTSNCGTVSGKVPDRLAPALNADLPPMPPGSISKNPRLFVTEAELSGWMQSANADEGIEYFRGFLIVDRDPASSRLRAVDQIELDLVAARVWSAAQQGLLHLVQRRHGTHDYSYLAVARSATGAAT